MRTVLPAALAAFFALLAACSEDEPTPAGPADVPMAAVTASGTVIRPGEDIQAKVNAAPTGTAFVLAPGVHRLQSVIPKSGMSFTGGPGVIMSGARLLTQFTRQGRYWVATGQTQQGKRYGGRPNGKPICDPAYPRCTYPEDLFIDNQLLKHVGSLSAVGPGKWYFDYEADKIYFAENPAGRTVETSVTPRAFAGTAANVTIRALTIEKYATPLTNAAVRADSAVGWQIVGNEVRWNHGIGILTGPRAVARQNRAHHNGQLGMGGAGDGAVVEDNEIAYNNPQKALGYGWAAGGTKWHNTKNLVLRRNFVHHNKGAGLWTDINNIYTLIEYNRVEDNARNGIFHEISYDAVIRYNTAARNGLEMPGLLRGGGIAVTSSPNVEIYGNTLTNNDEGFAINQDARGSGRYGPYEVKNLYVHDNTVTLGSGYTGLGVAGTDQSYYATKNNRFRNNKYTAGSNPKPFWWRNAARTWAEWQAYGQDVTGTFIP